MLQFVLAGEIPSFQKGKMVNFVTLRLSVLTDLKISSAKRADSQKQEGNRKNWKIMDQTATFLIILVLASTSI